MAIIKRLITSWIAAAYITAVISGGFAVPANFIDKAFTEGMNILLFIIIMFGFFLLLTYVSSLRFGFSSDDLALVLFLGLYSVLLTVNTQSIITVIAVLIPVSVAVFYLFYRDDRTLAAFNLSPRAGFAVACTAAIMLAVFIGAYTSCRYLTFGSPNYDFGIFCNMFASMARDFTQTVSSERDAIIQHFAVHFSPVYYLMLPFYYIFRSPVTLQILQALIVASGIIPLWLISRGRGLSPRASAVLSAIYAIYPAISGGCSYDLHENCFLTAFLLWLFWASERRDKAGNILLFVFAVLTLSVKEDAAVYVAFAGIYIAVEDGRDTDFRNPRQEEMRRGWRRRVSGFFTVPRINGILLVLISVAWFGFTSWFLTKFGFGIMSSRYSNFIPEGGGLSDLIRTVLTNPAIVFSESFAADKWEFIAQMFLPLACIPIITKKPHRLLLLMPLLLINLMPDYEYQHSIFFQYVFGSSAFIFYSAVLNLSEMKPKLRRTLLLLSLSSSILFFGAFIVPKSGYIFKYFENRDKYTHLECYLDVIEDDASVTASTFILPHIADRREIYQLKKGSETEAETDYVVIDLRGITEQSANGYIYAYENKGYDIVRCEYGMVLILEKNS